MLNWPFTLLEYQVTTLSLSQLSLVGKGSQRLALTRGCALDLSLGIGPNTERFQNKQWSCYPESDPCTEQALYISTPASNSLRKTHEPKPRP